MLSPRHGARILPMNKTAANRLIAAQRTAEQMRRKAQDANAKRDRAIRDALDQGGKRAEIAQILGISYQRVTKILERETG